MVDPVMVATSGAKLISDDAIETLKERLLPMADVLTQIFPEAEVLSGMEVRTEEDMIKAAEKISENYHCAVLLKGGHQLNDANDLLYRTEVTAGSTESALTIRIPTEQDARCPAPSRLIWRKA